MAARDGIRRVRLLWRASVLVYLPFGVLVPYVVLVADRPLPVRVVGVVLVVAFFAIYLPTAWRGVFRPADTPDPLLRLTACAVIGFAVVALFGPDSVGSLLTYTVYGIGGSLRRPPLVVVGVLGAVIVAGAVLFLVVGGPYSVFWAAYSVFAGLLAVAFGWLARIYGELDQARDELARVAVAGERLRFARDLHDLLGHSLSVIALKSELAGHLVERDPVRARAELADIESVTRDALAEVRAAVSGYRAGADLGEELRRAESALRAAGVEVEIDPAPDALPAEVESLLAWTVREGTTNIVRHAAAARATIRLRADADRAEIEVVDDGVGAPGGAAEGNGLTGLAERVSAAAGTFSSGAGQDGGYRLSVQVPR